MRSLKKTVSMAVVICSILSSAAYAESAKLDMKFAGALEFSGSGTLFVGDNINGSIYAFDLPSDNVSKDVTPIKIDDIDVRIANLLGVGKSAVEINDMAVHPVSHEIFISVSRIGNLVAKPALIKVSQAGEIELMDLGTHEFSKQELTHFPNQQVTFRPRGFGDAPPLVKDLAKGAIPLSSLAIMDMVYHDNELFVSGVAYDDFLSTLRRMPYPFDGKQSATSVEMYHIAHDQYETRAPIRAMSIQTIDGKEQLIAAYTCSPVVLVPLDELVDGAKVAAHTIGDMGNGQPIDMIPYKFGDQNMLFVTSNSRSPQVIPLNGLNGAKVVTDKDFERGGKMDIGPVLPYGPMGKAVMFDGASMHADALSDKFLVSITRDTQTGGLNLDSNMNFFPNRLHNLVAEFDFPQYYEDKAKQK